MAYPRDPHVEFYPPARLAAEQAPFTEREETTLRHVNRRIAAGESLTAVLDFLFEETAAIMPCDRIGLAFLEEERRVVAHWARAVYEPLHVEPGYAADLHGSTLEAILTSRSLRVINDLEAYLDGHPDSDSTRRIVAEGVRSSLTCPLWVDDRAVGFLFRSSRMPMAYSMREAQLHAAMAERLSQAVEKAWHIETLTQANRSYRQMLRFVNHELRSPLASVIMQGRALLDEMFGAMNPDQAESVQAMVERAEYLTGLTGEFLDLARYEGGDMRPAFMAHRDLAECVCRPALTAVAGLAEKQRVTLTADLPRNPVRASCDPTLLKIALNNLLSNALKYGNKPGRVRLQLREVGESYSLSVWNAGPGFDEESSKLLFRKFSRLPKRELLARPGTGVGLYLVWQIAQLHGGTATARSREGSWAEFTLTLARQPPGAPPADA